MCFKRKITSYSLTNHFNPQKKKKKSFLDTFRLIKFSRDQILNIHLNIIIIKIIILGEKRGVELGPGTIFLWSQREFVSNLSKGCVVNFIQFFLVYAENRFLSFWFPSLVYVVDGFVFGFYFLIGNLHMHPIKSKTIPPSSSEVRI